MGEDGVRRQEEGQAKHSLVATAQIQVDRNGVLVDYMVKTTNVLISWLTDDKINGFVGNYFLILSNGV